MDDDFWVFNTDGETIFQAASESVATHMAENNEDYIIFTASMYPYEEYPRKIGDYTDIGPECFTDGRNVISYKGRIFYRSCDVKVMDLPDGGASHCVSRRGHLVNQHEDMHGNVRYA